MGRWGLALIVAIFIAGIAAMEAGEKNEAPAWCEWRMRVGHKEDVFAAPAAGTTVLAPPSVEESRQDGAPSFPGNLFPDEYRTRVALEGAWGKTVRVRILVADPAGALGEMAYTLRLPESSETESAEGGTAATLPLSLGAERLVLVGRASRIEMGEEGVTVGIWPSTRAGFGPAAIRTPALDMNMIKYGTGEPPPYKERRADIPSGQTETAP